MPLAALKCPCNRCRGDEQTPETVLEHLAERPKGTKFTYELMAAMLAANQDRGERISTTTLTGKCLRSEYLKRKEPYTEDPEKMYASFRGTMFHGRLELYAHANSIAEARFHVDLPGLGHLSGSPDLLDVETGYLYDYKFSKENPRFEYAWGDHISQMNVNRWLVDNADYVEWDGGMYPLTEAGMATVHGASFEGPADELDADILQRNRTRFQPIDWQGLIVVYMDDKGPKPILITRSEDVPKVDGSGTKKAKVPDLWSDERCLEFITENYEKAKAALVGNELPDIPPGYEAWLHPLCGWCPVKARCVDLYIDNEVERRAKEAVR